MTVFSELCLRARKLGCKRLIFTADLFAEEESDGICASWTVVGGDALGREDAVGIAHGRTGEEALRALVAKLETPITAERVFRVISSGEK